MLNQTASGAARSGEGPLAQDSLRSLPGARGPVDLAAPQQGVDQPHQLPGGEHEGPAVLMPGDLAELAVVVGTELRTLQPDRVGPLDQVVPQVDVPALGEGTVLAFELPGLEPTPGEAGELRHLFLCVEPADVTELGDDAGGEHRAEPGDGVHGLGR